MKLCVYTHTHINTRIYLVIYIKWKSIIFNTLYLPKLKYLLGKKNVENLLKFALTKIGRLKLKCFSQPIPKSYYKILIVKFCILIGYGGIAF